MMMMMTVKASSFRKQFVAFLLIGLFTACATSDGAVSLTNIYKGQSVNGAHSRAIASNDNLIVIAGQNGNIAVHLLDTTKFNAPILDVIPDIEDFRDVFVTKSNNCVLMNAGENGVLYGVASRLKKIVLFDTAGVFLMEWIFGMKIPAFYLVILLMVSSF